MYTLGDPADGAVERRREEHRLPVLRQEANDPVDLRLEPHVEHPVGLVENEDPHTVELDQPALDEVLQPPGVAIRMCAAPTPLRLFA